MMEDGWEIGCNDGRWVGDCGDERWVELARNRFQQLPFFCGFELLGSGSVLDLQALWLRRQQECKYICSLRSCLHHWLRCLFISDRILVVTRYNFFLLSV
jgi:hypothetical protein